MNGQEGALSPQAQGVVIPGGKLSPRSSPDQIDKKPKTVGLMDLLHEMFEHLGGLNEEIVRAEELTSPIREQILENPEKAGDAEKNPMSRPDNKVSDAIKIIQSYTNRLRNLNNSINL